MIEKDVKAIVKRIIDAAAKVVPIYTMCPMTFGYGESGHPDRLLLINGCLLGIECKKDENNSLVRKELKPKSNEAAQRIQLYRIKKAGGYPMVVHAGNLDKFKALIEEIIGQEINVKTTKD